jgi:hypothetical protein
MPKADELTPIRAANDLDLIDDVAWSVISKQGWPASPELLFALKAFITEHHPEIVLRTKQEENNGS